MKDFLDNEFDVGDTVVYPAGSGRSITMVKARVVKFTDKSVVVQPLNSARWQQHHSTTMYRDTRTGKTFSKYADSAQAHMVRGFGYTRTETGEWFSLAHVRALPWTEHRNYSYAPVIWKDYVEEFEVGPKPVRLTVTKNIIKVDA